MRTWHRSILFKLMLKTILSINLILIMISFPSLLNGQYSQKDVKIVINQIESSQYPIIKAYISVLLNRKTPVLGLSQNSFSIFEDRVHPNKFELLSPNPKQGISVILALDTSGSMKEENRLYQAKIAANHFFSTLTEYDKCAIIAFDDSIREICKFTNDKNKLKLLMNSLTAQNDTRLYDGIYYGIEMLSRLPSGRKALIVLTDGKDEGSALVQNDCIQFANEENIPIYTAGFGSQSKVVKQPGARISILSNGEYFYTQRPESLRDLYGTISNRLKRQYVLQYESALSGDGQWHQLRVEVQDRNYAGFGVRNFHMPAIPYKMTWPTIVLTIIATLLSLALFAFLIVWLLKKYEDKKSKKIITHEIDDESVIIPNPGIENKKQPTQILNSSYAKTVILEKPYNTKLQKAGILDIKLPDNINRIADIKMSAMTIGSKPDNSVCLEGPNISDYHSKIELCDDKYTLYDLNSKNGTWVNNAKINQHPLADGDEIRIGDSILVFKIQ